MCAFLLAGPSFICLDHKSHGIIQLRVTLEMFSSMHWKNKTSFLWAKNLCPDILSDHQIFVHVISLTQSIKRQAKDLSSQYIHLEDQDLQYAQPSSSELGALAKEQMRQKTNAPLHPSTSWLKFRTVGLFFPFCLAICFLGTIVLLNTQ